MDSTIEELYKELELIKDFQEALDLLKLCDEDLTCARSEGIGVEYEERIVRLLKKYK